MKCYCCLTLLGLLATMPASAAEPPLTPPSGWQQTFDDEFTSLDLSRWTTQFPWGSRFISSKEEQIYVDPAYLGLGLNPFSIENGVLTITASRVSVQLREQLQGRHYISGLLTSYPRFAQLYGYFEMRARLPPGRGLWPTFWLAPIDLKWPPEIDIVETVGEPTKLYATIHFGRSPEHPRHTGFAIDVPDMTTGFHSYGVLWTSQVVAWYFDQQRIAFTATPPDMHQKMYLMINLAVGGAWPGSPTPQTPFPAKLRIDYIRAYSLPGE
jgi:beta-glucanase (GH16 family)